MALVRKEPKLLLGWRTSCCFQIGLAYWDKPLLEKLQSTFKVGTINKAGDNAYLYRVTSPKDLLGVIIPFFDKYPLLTQKNSDFVLFKQIVEAINNKEHLHQEGLQRILNLRASINLGLSPELKAAFPDTVAKERPLVMDISIRDPRWFVGFTEGEGCFSILIINKTKGSALNKSRINIVLDFQLTQHSRDILLIKSLVDYLGCGNVYYYPDKSALLLLRRRDDSRLRLESNGVYFKARAKEDLKTKILPIFEKYPLKGVKNLNLLDFIQAVKIIDSKDHLTEEGLNKILDLRDQMNSQRQYD
uniref:Homing endonuclease LAGLIDADG domain-containing protein n=1 Tax=Annulohypoxylon stygium TaxID=326628 RepID=A0A386RWF2_9PEZI|nr:hypothetical protein [Annulohypoxylon stygium]